MIEILKKAKQTAQLMRSQDFKENTRYKWSYFVYPYSEDGKDYLHHNLTKQIYALEENDIAYDKSRIFTSDEIKADKVLLQLHKDYYLVEEAMDEDTFFEELRDVLVAMDKAKKSEDKGIKCYIIMPTTACNARCFYCFEEGMKIVTMTPETVQATIDFIMRTKYDGRIILRWFGGEPLLRPDIIDTICTALTENNVEYISTISTNASLITEELAHKMKNLWHISECQVPFDGNEVEYIKRKAYINPTENPYQLVMNNVRYLLNEGIKVNLRCNFDEDNLYSINEYIDDITARFHNNPNLEVYFIPLFQSFGTDKEFYLFEKSQELLSQVGQKGFNSNKNFHQGKIKLYFCPAQQPDIRVCIAPDGKLYPCTNLDEKFILGNVFEGVTNKEAVEELSEQPPVSEKCTGCMFVADCTTFKHCNTINSSTECKKRNELLLNYYLKGIIHN